MTRKALLLTAGLLALGCGGDGEDVMVNVRVEVTEVTADAPVEGASVCLGDTCVMTDATGFTDIMAPAESDLTFRVTHPDYAPGLMPFTTTAVDGTFEAEIAEPGTIAILLSLVGASPDPAKGQLLMLAGGPMGMSGVSDMTYAISPMDGMGPVYFDEGAMPDPSLTATSGAGAGAIANIEPGNYVFSFNGPRECEFEIGYHRGAANEAGFPIEAGALTIISMEECAFLPD